MPWQVERASSAQDWAAIRKICELTGKPGGEPIEAERRGVFSEIWIGPYEKLSSEGAYVLREGGRVGGYLVGVADTRSFARKRLLKFEVSLFGKILFGKVPQTLDAKRFAREFVLRKSRPENQFSKEIRQKLLSEYPAHLHTNLLPEFRGKGGGRALIERFAADLQARGVVGVHCICGEAPRGFYENAGLKIIGKTLVRGSIPLYALGKSISV